MHPQPIPKGTLDPDAVAVLLHPDGLPRLTVQAAWDALKSARGQTCDWHQLNAMPCHHPQPVIRALPAQAITETVAEITTRCQGRAAASMKRRMSLRPSGYTPTGGDAA